MTSPRDQFIDYVRNGGKAIFSPQIGAGAGFDTRLAGKQWVTQTTLEDTIAATARFDMLPLFNLGLVDLGECNPALAWKEVKLEQSAEKVSREQVLQTPAGSLTRSIVEEPRKGCFQPKYPMTDSNELPVLEYYLDAALDGDFSVITKSVRDIVNRVALRGAVGIQWAAQPYELLCFPNTVDTVLIVNDNPDLALKLMEKVMLLNEKIIPAVAAGGADFIFLGGPGSEMISPAYYKNYLVPFSKRVSALAHQHGLLIYSHICSPIEPMLSMGFYSEMGIDLFETLSPPPVGNVASLKDAFTHLDPRMCTRGNLGLDVLLQATPQVVREKTLEILEASAGRKHVVAASDYLFYGIKEENIHAMEQAVKEFHGR